MNLDDLRTAQVAERGTDSLQPLHPSFYADAAAYLEDLREQRDRLAEQVDDPYAEEVSRLTDELETAEEVVEAIYDRRVGKLVKRASLAAAGMPADEEGLTTEERALFADLVERIEANREDVLATLDGEGKPTPASAESSVDEPAPEPPADEPPDQPLETGEGRAVDSDPASPSPGSAPGVDADQQTEPDGGSTAVEPAAKPADPAPDAATDDTDRLTVRITASVGEIYGVDDRVYTLDSEDVVSLPAPNAKPLLERGAARRVD